MKALSMFVVLLASSVISAQQVSTLNERKVSLSEMAIALDSTNVPALEARLLTTALNGTQDSPVANVRFSVRNVSQVSYAFVSGVVTFYDAAGMRCGEGVFKADALAVGEAFETDSPGVRIRCTATSWRAVATQLVPRTPPLPTPVSARLVITVDGQSHPLQLDRPLTLNVGDKKRTIVVSEGH